MSGRGCRKKTPSTKALEASASTPTPSSSKKARSASPPPSYDDDVGNMLLPPLPADPPSNPWDDYWKQQLDERGIWRALFGNPKRTWRGQAQHEQRKRDGQRKARSDAADDKALVKVQKAELKEKDAELEDLGQRLLALELEGGKDSDLVKQKDDRILVLEASLQQAKAEAKVDQQQQEQRMEERIRTVQSVYQEELDQKADELNEKAGELKQAADELQALREKVAALEAAAAAVLPPPPPPRPPSLPHVLPQLRSSAGASIHAVRVKAAKDLPKFIAEIAESGELPTGVELGGGVGACAPHVVVPWEVEKAGAYENPTHFLAAADLMPMFDVFGAVHLKRRPDELYNFLTGGAASILAEPYTPPEDRYGNYRLCLVKGGKKGDPPLYTFSNDTERVPVPATHTVDLPSNFETLSSVQQERIFDDLLAKISRKPGGYGYSMDPFPSEVMNATPSKLSFPSFTSSADLASTIAKSTGVTTYAYYVSDRCSTFHWHNEDGGLRSVNTLLDGACKLWVLIRPGLEPAVWEACAESFPNFVRGIDDGCPQRGRHLCAIPSLSFLRSKEIPFTLVLQKPGDTVFVDGRTIHFGLNLGPNSAASANLEGGPTAPMDPGCGCSKDVSPPDGGIRMTALFWRYGEAQDKEHEEEPEEEEEVAPAAKGRKKGAKGWKKGDSK